MKKTILSALAGTALLTTSGMMTAAQAGTQYPSYSTHIELNGAIISSPYHIVAKDYPSASQPTSWLAIWYLMQALDSLQIVSYWDGHTWNLTLPSGMNVDLSSLPSGQGLTANNMAIALNGKVVQYAPRIAYKDPGGTQTTSYAPIWYVMQVLTRIGIQYKWDGTNWSMTAQSGPSISKLQAVRDFVNTLHLTPDSSGTNPYSDVSASDWPYVNVAVQKGYFQADSSSKFGSTDSVSRLDVDHAYQLYRGIPDSHMSWNAGGNTDAWGTAIHLNQGVGSGIILTTGSERAMMANLAALYKGYTVDSSGTYHLWFQPSDIYTQFSQSGSLGITASVTSQQESAAIDYIDRSTFVISENNELTFKLPGISDHNLFTANCVSIFNPSGNLTQYSLDNGVTWKRATGPSGYFSRDTQNGGTSTPPSFVLVKTIGHTDLGTGYILPKLITSFGQAGFVPNGTHTPSIKYGFSNGDLGI